MRYRLRTLLILLAAGPPMLAGAWFGYDEYRFRRKLRESDANTQQPFYYEVDGGKPFALAGLWEWWRGTAGKDEPLESCSLITTDANTLQAEIHDRMPVILDSQAYDTWLDPANDDTVSLQSLLLPYSAKHMTARPVNTYVNNARHEGPECLGSPNA